MARKCRLKTCRAELPRKRDCTDPIQAGGFCGQTCMWAHVDQRRSEAAQRKVGRPRTMSRIDPEKRKRNAESKPHQTKLTQDACNKLVRLLDEGKPCISCGQYRELEAGHFKTTASKPEIRFLPIGIFGQCRPCNQAGTIRRKRGKDPDLVADEYERRLRLRIGDEAVDWLKGPHPMPHYSVDDLKAMRKVFNAECRRIERGEGPSRDWRKYDV